MSRADLVEGSAVRPLEGCPERFNAVGMRHVPDMLGYEAPYAFMVAGQGIVDFGIIGIDRCIDIRIR